MDGSSRDSGSSPSPGNSQVAKVFLGISGTDPLKKQLHPSGPIASRASPVQFFVE